MPAIYVCPLSRLGETVAATGARHVVTLINADTVVPRPPSVAEADHLFLGMHDIAEAMDGFTVPAEGHVSDLLGYFRRWDRQAPVVVHCFAGISRSTAAAFSAFCALRPDLDEDEVAQRLRARSPEATPNPRIIAHADRLLRRGGRMIRAVERIGRGANAFEGTVFAFKVDEA